MVMVGTALAAPQAASRALDTVRTTFDDGRVARMYTVLRGTDVREGMALSYHPMENLPSRLRTRTANWMAYSVPSTKTARFARPSGSRMAKKKALASAITKTEKRKAAKSIVAAY